MIPVARLSDLILIYPKKSDWRDKSERSQFDAYRIRTYRNKATFSLDFLNEIREVPSDGPLPEELVEQRKAKELLYQGLRSLPEKQRSRLIAYYFLSMNKAEIARCEGSNVNSVKESIRRGLRALEKFFEKNLF